MDTPAGLRIIIKGLLDAIILLVEVGEGALDLHVVRFGFSGEADANIRQMEISTFRATGAVIGKDLVRQRFELERGDSGDISGKGDMVRIRFRSRTARMDRVVLADLEGDFRLAFCLKRLEWCPEQH